MRGTMTARGGAALTALLMLAGAATAQTAGGPSPERGAKGGRAMPPASGAAAPSGGRATAKGPFDNQTKKLSNPLGANGK